MAQVFQNMVPIRANSAPVQTCSGGADSPDPGAVHYFRPTVTPARPVLPMYLSPHLVIDLVMVMLNHIFSLKIAELVKYHNQTFASEAKKTFT